MTLAQLIETYVSHQRSLGRRFESAAKIFRMFDRAMKPVDVAAIDQDTVRAFLNRSPLSSSWHTKYYALHGLFRFAVQRGLLAASPMPYLIPKRPAYATPYVYAPEETPPPAGCDGGPRCASPQERATGRHSSHDIPRAHPASVRCRAAAERGALPGDR